MNYPTEAAIRLPDGKVFVGHFHGDALWNAADVGYSDEVLEKAELGFSHSDGTAFVQPGTTALLPSIASDD